MAQLVKQYVIRVRGPTAMWRVETMSPTSTISDVKKYIEQHHGVPLSEQRLHLQRGCTDAPLAIKNTLKSCKLRHGSILYIAFDTTKVNVLEQSTKRVIAEDGSLVAVRELTPGLCFFFLSHSFFFFLVKSNF